MCSINTEETHRRDILEKWTDEKLDKWMNLLSYDIDYFTTLSKMYYKISHVNFESNGNFIINLHVRF